MKVQTEKAGVSFAAISKEKFEQRDAADVILGLLQEQKTLCVQSVEKKEVNQEPPLLYDLTTLQKEANSKHGFSADKTLSIAQKLYEAKLTTYPRTGSRYIPSDVLAEIYILISGLWDNTVFGKQALALSNSNLNLRSVDDKKITDHHAIIITENSASGLSGDDKTIYEMIAGRMLEAFSKKCVKDATTIRLACGDTIFETKGSVIKQAGWRAVFDDREENEDEVEKLPTVIEGETLSVLQSEVLEKQTKPKSIHTESSLLGTMEDSGIGTPATRAAIIETLFARDYVRREKKSLLPTDKGLSVYEIVKDKRIADVALTGSWENTLSQIEAGEMDADTFRQANEIYTRQITAELLNVSIAISGENECACPKCKTGKMIFYPKVAKCSETNCGLIVFRNKSEKQLSDKQITDLLTTGKTPVIKGFKSKGGKSFDASLAFDADYKIVFDFPEKKEKK
ncbi:DNA topoisomerase 3 [Bacteroidales bacterium Barb7]|nr:DNA topoisomerase 3 [Bacteroidales bacterium Barb7]